MLAGLIERQSNSCIYAYQKMQVEPFCLHSKVHSRGTDIKIS